MRHPHRFTLAFTAMFLASMAFAQPSFPTPKTYPPDAATLKQIEAKTAELRKAVEGLPRGKLLKAVWADVAVYHKAAEWIVRHGEWFQKDSAQQTLRVLDAGLNRAMAAAQGKTPWVEVRGKPVILGYQSVIDGSIQPYRVTIPIGYTPGDGKKWRIDVVLHGRDGSLNEVKFLNAAETAKPGPPREAIVIEPYGRGNNAYRWAGEVDVFEAESEFISLPAYQVVPDPNRRVLRGFSMGGAGTWHIGLHHPFRYSVIGPGAGFSTTRGYIKNIPPKLPDYQEKCLRIYDAVDYAENAFNIPVVAYSGEKDAQKAAADNIENALKGFKERLRFTHLVAPGLEHKMPPEWQAKADAEYRQMMALPRSEHDRVRFVTYTPKYGDAGWATITALVRQYEKAVFDGTWDENGIRITTSNVRAFQLKSRPKGDAAPSITVDGQTVPIPSDKEPGTFGLNIGNPILLKSADGRWSEIKSDDYEKLRIKKGTGVTALQGPIDDAFTDTFSVAGPTRPGWTASMDRYATTSLRRFETEWDKWMRGNLPVGDAKQANVLFGDPQSNPRISEILPQLPITWTKERLVVNGIEYDARTHVPVMIYPVTEIVGSKNLVTQWMGYIVLNSGHTFHDADFRGTNALLYPRLGDWAVLKPTPTKDDPAAAEVVAAGLFDENWQFPKKSK